ncbi:MAG TPA: porin [Phycisphaerales bacterium]|nr:porin [Phycisphaerales bacterium]
MTRPMVLSLVAAAGLAAPALAATSSDDVRAIVSEMMSDAETRSSLLAGGDAGHDGKFFIAGDGFRLNVGGAIQTRYLMDFRDDSNSGDDFSNGFQDPKTRVNFGGTVNKDWNFWVDAQFDTTGEGSGQFKLLDALFGYNFANGWGLYVGQLKPPIIREDAMSDFKLLAVERAPSTDFLRHDRVKAVWLQYQAENWRTWLTFNSGANTDNTDFNASNNADYAFSARFEFLFAGKWDQFADFTSPKGSDFGAMLGIAAHYQGPHNTPNPADVDTSVFLYTADLGLEGDGWNLFGSFIGRHIEQDTLGTDGTDLDDFSFVIQGGLMLTDKFEIFGRYDALIVDDDRGFNNDYMSWITGGVNYYFAGHAIKFTGDVVYAIDDTLPDVSALGGFSTTQGLQGDTTEGEVAIRLQMQLLF